VGLKGGVGEGREGMNRKINFITKEE